ncbi:hypothetical protein GYH30_000993 [Glycine max]|uniref:K-box domain-containing protein n=1 Tax=Glycine max TaxID=3847 RepID=A0A0R0LFE7_SOYBN|nr:hypothetical protein GYH30_000993 [Glycine max]
MHRKFLGEGLGACSIEELQWIEQQLERSLSNVRARKIQVFKEQIEQLKEKEKVLLDENAKLTENGRLFEKVKLLLFGINFVWPIVHLDNILKQIEAVANYQGDIYMGKPLDGDKITGATNHKSVNLEGSLLVQHLFKDHRRCSYMIANALDKDGKFTTAQVSRKLKQLGLYLPLKSSGGKMHPKGADLMDRSNERMDESDDETLVSLVKRKKMESGKLSRGQLHGQTSEDKLSKGDSDDEMLSSVLKKKINSKVSIEQLLEPINVDSSSRDDSDDEMLSSALKRTRRPSLKSKQVELENIQIHERIMGDDSFNGGIIEVSEGKMLKKMKKQPLLFVELLFWKTRRECHYINAEYLLSELGHLKKESANWNNTQGDEEIGSSPAKVWTQDIKKTSLMLLKALHLPLAVTVTKMIITQNREHTKEENPKILHLCMLPLLESWLNLNKLAPLSSYSNFHIQLFKYANDEISTNLSTSYMEKGQENKHPHKKAKHDQSSTSQAQTEPSLSEHHYLDNYLVINLGSFILSEARNLIMDDKGIPLRHKPTITKLLKHTTNLKPNLTKNDNLLLPRLRE